MIISWIERNKITVQGYNENKYSPLRKIKRNSRYERNNNNNIEN